MRPNTLPAGIGLFVVIAVYGCGGTSHMTDLRATDSQDVGAFDIANARANGDRLTAQVCVARPGSAEDVSDRVLHELMNKGYNRIDLDLISSDPKGGAERRQVTWTPDQGKQMQGPSKTGDNPCLRGGQVSTSGDSGRQRSPVGTESTR